MKKTKPNGRILTVDGDLYSGMMCLHVLHHATERPIFGLGIVEELARYGYLTLATGSFSILTLRGTSLIHLTAFSGRLSFRGRSQRDSGL